MEPISAVLVAPTADRKSPPSSFGATFRAAVAGAADGLAAASGLLAPFAPAGMVLAGAVRGASQGLATGARASATSAGAGIGTAAGTAGAAAGAAGIATGAAGTGDAFEAARLLQQEGQSFNLKYLELQERLQRETREFTAVSNVMKVRHDAARAAIQNVQ
jgi:hypothetical protein